MSDVFPSPSESPLPDTPDTRWLFSPAAFAELAGGPPAVPFSSLAIWGFLVSVFSVLVTPFSLLGVVLSVVGVVRIRNLGLRGHGLANAGIILGALVFAVYVVQRFTVIS
jgi:hypothetical protein